MAFDPARAAQGPALMIILGGRSGTGKTTVARALAPRLAALHVRIDTIEEAIAGNGAPVGELGYRVGYAVAEDNLRLGHNVIADSVNPLEITRRGWRSVATRVGAAAIEIEIICSDPVEHRRRVETRAVDTTARRQLTWDDVGKRDYEPWTSRHLMLDTAGRSVADGVAVIIDALGAL